MILSIKPEPVFCGSLSIGGELDGLNLLPAVFSKPRRESFLGSLLLHAGIVAFLASIHLPLDYSPPVRVHDPKNGVTVLYFEPRQTLPRPVPRVDVPSRRSASPTRPLEQLPLRVRSVEESAARVEPPSVLTLVHPGAFPRHGLGEPTLAAPPAPRLPVASGFKDVREPIGADRAGGTRVSMGSFSSLSGPRNSTNTFAGIGGGERLAGFPGVSTPDPQAHKTSLVSPIEPSFERAKIIEAPKPEYTDLARNRGIEGLVRMSVVFKADGHVVVTGITHSLGFGLDETATAAVTRIRFRPARLDGKEVDQPGVVEAVFQLAYRTLTADEIR
jgi:TonB family protein